MLDQYGCVVDHYTCAKYLLFLFTFGEGIVTNYTASWNICQFESDVIEFTQIDFTVTKICQVYVRNSVGNTEIEFDDNFKTIEYKYNRSVFFTVIENIIGKNFDLPSTQEQIYLFESI